MQQEQEFRNWICAQQLVQHLAFTAGSVCVVAASDAGSPLGNSVNVAKQLAAENCTRNITGDPFAGVCGQTYTPQSPIHARASGDARLFHPSHRFQQQHHTISPNGIYMVQFMFMELMPGAGSESGQFI